MTKNRENGAEYSATRGTGTDGTDSVGTRRRLAGALAVALAAVVILAGCPEVNDTAAPRVSDTSFTRAGATVSITVNETGKLFWVLYADDAGTPANAAALIIAASKAKNAPIIASSGGAGQAITTAGVQTVSLIGFASETNYDFYFVAQDATGNTSALSDKLDILAPDTAMPTISNPSTTTVTTSSATFRTTVNEIGKLFWVIYADETTAPADAAALITDAGKDKTVPIIASSGSAGQAVPTTGVQTISVSDLPNGTDYDFYAVAQDTAGNASALSAKADARIALAQVVTTSTVTLVSGQISIAVTNPNTGAVRVRVGISPAVTGVATYAIGRTAFSNAATTGFALAANATQTLTIGRLTDGTTYTVSLTTIGSNGVAHSSVVNQSIALIKPDAFTVTAANSGGVAIVSSNLRTMATINWTNPGNAISVAIATSPATGVTASAVTTTAGASNSVTVSGLSPKTAYTFTVTATNGVGDTPVATTLTPPLPVVFWEASSGTDGDFGFAYCQTELSGGATDLSGVHKTLYDAGYRTAKFFGSTPDYDFNDIATDTDALGAVDTRPLVTAAGSSFTVREISSGTAMTLADFTKSANRNVNGDIDNLAVRRAFDSVVTTNAAADNSNIAWMFSTRLGTYDSSDNCSGAESNSTSVNGREGIQYIGVSNIRLGTTTPRMVPTPLACSNTISVLCIAQ